jgi:energy-coupling factor transport system substrate-specific component
VSGARSESRFSFAFSARDLVNTAVFAVIFIVVGYVIGMLGVISPLVWLLALPAAVLVNGITFMLFVTRVRHAGMVTLFAAVVALFYLIGGNNLLSTASVIAIGAIADLILAAGRYRSGTAAIWAYTVFGLAYATPFVPLFIDPDGYFATGSWQQMGEEYRQAAQQLLSPAVIGIFVVALAVAALLGALLGRATLRKHFVKAGLA